jgi:osmotically inducible lipoprotein OsmB
LPQPNAAWSRIEAGCAPVVVVRRALAASTDRQAALDAPKWNQALVVAKAIRKETTMSIRTRTLVVTLSSAAALVLGGCAGMSPEARDTAVGAAIGGVAGSVLTGGSTAGTVGGAVIGGVIGHEARH